MLKAFRRVKETATMSGQDADDKKKLAEIRDAAATLLKTLQFYYKTFQDHNANAAAVHEDIANLYPANQRLSVAVAHLHTEGKVFTEAMAVVEELRKELEPPLNSVLGRIKDLNGVADERAFARAEIEHYKEKVTRLANEGLQDAKKQDKAESNQAKLKENQEKFNTLDAELTAALAALDAEIASLTNSAVASFLSMHVSYNRNVTGVYEAALRLANGAGGAAMVTPVGEAETSAPAAPAGGSDAAAEAAGVPAASAVPAEAPAAPAVVSMDAFTSGLAGMTSEGGAAAAPQQQVYAEPAVAAEPVAQEVAAAVAEAPAAETAAPEAAAAPADGAQEAAQ